MYTGIDLVPDNIAIALKHLSYFGYKDTFYEMDVEKMVFNQEFDFVYSFGVLHPTPNIETAVENIFKALKVGGEAQIIVYNKRSVFYVLNVVLADWILWRGFLKRTLAEQRSMIEYSANYKGLPLVNVYSPSQIKN